MSKLPTIILRELSRNELYCRKVIAFINIEYFTEPHEKVLFKYINFYFTKYNTIPSKESLEILLDNTNSINETLYKETQTLIKDIFQQELEGNLDWLVEESEKFCKDSALYNALGVCLEIQNGNSKEPITAIPDILKEALAVSFDTSIGHDYFENSGDRFDWYNRKVDKIPFLLSSMNYATQGGVERKTLNCIAGTTGSGKSMFLCYLAASYLQQGYDVLYITLELSEEKVAERIDANLMNIPLSEVKRQSKTAFSKNIKNLKEKTQGTLKIKEYATASVHVGHFRHLLTELNQKKKFKADIIIIDYLSICRSSRQKDSSNMYSYVKSIAEEIRGLAVENEVAIWTATQLNRDSYNSDPDITGTAQSMGLPDTLDFYFASVRTEELDKEGKILFKQLKSRYDDLNKKPRILLGCDISRMNYYELENSQYDINPTEQPVESIFSKAKNERSNFSGFK
jgi:archaellum biogenesis ATPase FlaH